MESEVLSGTVHAIEMTSSDERLTGTGQVYIDRCDFTFTEADGSTVGRCTATTVLINDGGGWEGTDVGTTSWTTTSPEHAHVFDSDYVGTGGYEGLRYTGELRFSDDGVATLTGRIAPAE